MIFGISLLMFPEEIQKLAPENQYMKTLMQYKQLVAVVSILFSVYLYMGSCEPPSSTASVTISSPLPSEQVTTTTKSS